MLIGQNHAKLNVPALGRAFSKALAVLFIIAMLVALFIPIRSAHGVMTTIFHAPIDSSRIWVNGIVWALIVGWIVATVAGATYNFIVARRVVHRG